MADRLLLLSSVMKTFDASRTTIWRWIKDGYLEQRKLGCSRKVYITESSVNRLIDTGMSVNEVKGEVKKEVGE